MGIRDRRSCGILALCVRDITRGNQATYHEIPLEPVATLDQFSGIAAMAAPRAIHASNVAVSRDASRDALAAAHDARTAAPDATVADAYATVAGAYGAARRSGVFAYFVRTWSRWGGFKVVMVQCSCIFKGKIVFQIPEHLFLPLLFPVYARSDCIIDLVGPEQYWAATPIPLTGMNGSLSVCWISRDCRLRSNQMTLLSAILCISKHWFSVSLIWLLSWL